MSLLMSLLVLLVCSRIFGEVFKKFNQPTLLGEIFAGILLGPAILDLVKLSPALAGIVQQQLEETSRRTGIPCGRALTRFFRGCRQRRQMALSTFLRFPEAAPEALW